MFVTPLQRAIGIVLWFTGVVLGSAVGTALVLVLT